MAAHADAIATRIIVALDVSDPAEASQIIRETKQYVGWYKVGLELIAGQNCSQVVSWIKQAGCKVFYDIKLNDIPTTVEKAVKAARSLEVDLINVHATAGVEAMRKAKEAAGEATMVAAVTVLTSMNHDDLRSLGFDMSTDVAGYSCDDDVVGGLVTTLASQAHLAGIPALICSSKDLEYLRREDLFDKFIKITPGIRPTWATANDQKRVMTPSEAILAGSDMIVVGRPITNPPDGMTRNEAARQVYAEIWDAQLSPSGS